MINYVDSAQYLAARRGSDYWINLVVEEEDSSSIVMSIRHSFTGVRNDGIFLISFFEGVKDFHFTVHADGTRHMKYVRDQGGENTIELPQLASLMELTKPAQLFTGGLNLRAIRQISSRTAREIDRFCNYPDQIITLNRKHAKTLDSIGYSIWMLPRGNQYTVPLDTTLNPSIFVFNVLEPPIALEIGYETMPREASLSNRSYHEINVVSQISDANRIFVDFDPTLSSDGTKLQIPEWKFVCKNKEYSMPPTTVDLQENCRLVIGAFNGEDYYYYDAIGAKIEPFDRDGPIAPSIVWIQGGIVNILKHIRA